MLLAGDSPVSIKPVLDGILRILTVPLWFFDAVDKEAFVLSIPISLRRQILRVMFYPTLLWTMLLHRLMPDQRRWYDRIDSRVIIGALPLKRQLDTLARVEGVTPAGFKGSRLLSCASSGRTWRLWASRHFHEHRPGHRAPSHRLGCSS